MSAILFFRWDGLSNAACMSYWQIWRLGWLSFFSVTTTMFLVAELEDTVKIEPKHFDKSDNEAITEVLNQKFANKVGAKRQRAKEREKTDPLYKVIPDVGLCICVHDILEASPGAILHGDGCSYIKSKISISNTAMGGIALQ